MDAEEKARIEAEMAEKLEALKLMENEKREKDEELERIRLQVHTLAHFSITALYCQQKAQYLGNIG